MGCASLSCLEVSSNLTRVPSKEDPDSLSIHYIFRPPAYSERSFVTSR